MIKKMREEFEAWADSLAFRAYPLEWDEEQSLYCNQKANIAWQAWKASRESLVVELPSSWAPVSYEDEIRNEMRGACEDAIHAAGVKTK